MAELLDRARSTTRNPGIYHEAPAETPPVDIADLESTDTEHIGEDIKHIIERVERSSSYIPNPILRARLATLARMGYKYGLGLDPSVGFGAHDKSIRQELQNITFDKAPIVDTPVFLTVYDAYSGGVLQAIKHARAARKSSSSTPETTLAS